MSHPEPDVLADLALGEPVTDDVRDHVSGCAVCEPEVEELGAVLLATRGPAPELVPPPPSVRAAVLAQIASSVDDGPTTAAPIPDDELAARRRATRDDGLPRRARPAPPVRSGRRFSMSWLVAAAAAGVLVGGAGALAVERTGEPPAESVVLAQADLDTLDTGATLGVADLVEHDGITDLTLHTDPLSPDDGYLEVWLINTDGERMVSIGVLEPDRPDQTFAVPADLVAQGYVVVDISREHFDDDATHSGDSLARGTLPV